MAAVCGTSGIASLFSQAAFAADSDIADGQTQRFDFSILQSMAHDLAQTAWRGAPRPLPDTLATMTPQAYNSIQYDAEKSLWHNVENRQLDAQFFHMGMGFRRRVRMFSVDPATHLIDTYTDSKEEFPDFTAFWFDTVKPGATTFTVYALLDSASITGAYKFTIHCEKNQVIMDVENHLYARKDIKQLGIAPMTSMFSCGTNERRMCDTIHPQIHDSDRLSMWRGNGEWICRPLNNPQKLQFNAYTDNNPKGFGLLQLDRDFSHYQDIMGWYNKRPSLWVEPRNKWGKGTIGLMEIPTTGETLDNIVCFWQPEKAVKAGDEFAFQYRLYWSAQPPVHCPLARVMATRTGMGGFPEGWAPGEHYPEKWARRFAVDFVGGDLKAAAPKGIEPVITLSSGEAKQIEILYIEPIDGYRIQFDWYPTSDSTDPVDMRMYLRCQGDAISETWLYQYFPPAPDKRQYVDDRVMS